MSNSRGSISWFFLIICLVLALISQLMLIWCLKEQEHCLNYVRECQLRLLGGSIFNIKSKQQWGKGEYLWYEGKLEPGNSSVKVLGKSLYSDDGLINYLEVTAKTVNNLCAAQQYKQITMNINKTQQKLAGIYSLVAHSIKGLEYLPNEGVKYIQVKKEEVILPQVDFLYGKCINSVSKKDIEHDGLSCRFYYCQADELNFPENCLIHGSSLVSNTRSINLGADSHFTDRVTFISQGSIYIEKNVVLEEALIMASGDVVINAGCKIKGMIIANRIILLGKSQFISDANVVAPFTSVTFINTV